MYIQILAMFTGKRYAQCPTAKKRPEAVCRERRLREAIGIKCMTEVAEFSVWAKIRRDEKREFRRWMAAQTGWREIDVHRLLGAAVDAGRPIELFHLLGWEDVQVELGRLPAFVEAGTEQLTVTSFAPIEQAPYCAVHSLYTWNRGCPVCEDNYVHRSRRSKPGPFMSDRFGAMRTAA
jgi:hypothetical protein